jgi:hypothetical protein
VAAGFRRAAVSEKEHFSQIGSSGEQDLFSGQVHSIFSTWKVL